jgi:hypothetical protein
VSPVIVALLAIHLSGSSVTFRFTAPPTAYGAAYVTGPLAECGSGRIVALRGAARFVIHFRPARTALSFAKQRRIEGAGRFRELAKVCDFESDLGWAIGLDRRRAYRVSRAGRTVTITFR